MSSELKGPNSERNHFGDADSHRRELQYDLVILATGYTRTEHEQMLSPIRQGTSSIATPSPNESISVSKNYKMSVKGLSVSKNAGIWLQGCNEDTHGVS
jgi:L-ornithine N5-oxygenase